MSTKREEQTIILTENDTGKTIKHDVYPDSSLESTIETFHLRFGKDQQYFRMILYNKLDRADDKTKAHECLKYENLQEGRNNFVVEFVEYFPATSKRSLDDSISERLKRQKTMWQSITPEHNWPPLMPSEFKLNHTYSIPHLDIASIVGFQPTQQLFFRRQTLELYNSLSALRTRKPSEKQGKCKGVIIEGASGIGKSCTTWAWILSQLTSNEPADQISPNSNTANIIKTKSVLWIHLQNLTAYCVRLTKDNVQRARLILTDETDLSQLQQIIYKAADDIVVLDGFVSSEERHDRLLEHLEMSDSNFFHIQVASSAYILKGQRDDVKKERGIEFLAMGPWSLDDYKLACDNPVFYRSVAPNLTNLALADTVSNYNKEERENLLKEKFVFAGACARLMFATRFDEN